jgi:hypothetical protein
MVKTTAPRYASLAMDLITSYVPKEEKVASWHTVVDGHKESFETIAKKYGIPVATLINFNFPGSATNGRIDPDVVNWFLFNHQRFRCRQTTHDGMNYVFRSGQKVAVPHLGQVELGEPEFIRSSNTRFKIRMHANLNAGAGLAADFSIFEIWDQKAKLCSFYTYGGTGISASVLPGWLSATLKGPWNDFSVTTALGANEFAGPARFTSGGAGSSSANYVHFMLLPRGAQTMPSPLRISTGFTIGIGGSTSVGTMTLVKAGEPDGLLPFRGP